MCCWRYLRNESGKPYADEQRVAMETLEHIALPMNLAGVDLVEQSHHDERVEDYGEVLIGRRTERCVSAAVDVEQLFACLKTSTTTL